MALMRKRRPRRLRSPMARRVSADLSRLMVVHAEKKRGIDRPGLDGLAQDRGCAGFGQQLEPTWRFDADNSNNRRHGEVRAGLQKRRRIDG